MKRVVRWVALFLFLAFSCSSAFAGPSASGNSTGQQNSVDEEQVQKLQNSMLGDSQIMALVLALQNDPAVQALLSDPSFVQAITNRDINTLVNDPRFVKLLSNPQIKEIMKRLEQ